MKQRDNLQCQVSVVTSKTTAVVSVRANIQRDLIS
jgi:hypothetical protein